MMPTGITRVGTPPEDRLKEAIEWAQADEPNPEKCAVRLRCELRLYNPAEQQYSTWPGSNFTIDVAPNVETGMGVREAVELLIQKLAEEGPAAVVARLRAPKVEEPRG